MLSSIEAFAKGWLLPPRICDFLRNLRKQGRSAFRPSDDRQRLTLSRRLKDSHSGERCFLLGAGSSIAEQDLSKLIGEVVLAVSNTFVHPLYKEIQPRYHLVPSMQDSHGRYYGEEHFVTWLQAMEIGTGTAEMILHIGDRGMIERNGLFQGRVIHWVDFTPWDERRLPEIDPTRIPAIWSVSELAVTMAVYMDFKEIYLLGMDHDWFNGVLIYFFDHKTQHLLKPAETNLSHVDAEFQMRRHADIFRKYKLLFDLKKNIFNANANPHHYLDTFPKVDFNSLFE